MVHHRRSSNNVRYPPVVRVSGGEGASIGLWIRLRIRAGHGVREDEEEGAEKGDKGEQLHFVTKSLRG